MNATNPAASAEDFSLTIYLAGALRTGYMNQARGDGLREGHGVDGSR